MKNLLKPVTASLMIATTDLKVAKMIGGYILIKETWDRSELPVKVEKFRQNVLPEIIKRKNKSKITNGPFKIYNKLKDSSNLDIIMATTIISTGILKYL